MDLAIVTEEEAYDMSKSLVDGFRAQLSKTGDLSLDEKHLTESQFSNRLMTRFGPV